MADITATVGNKTTTTANINVNTGDGPESVSVTLPSTVAVQNSSLKFALLGDVETTNLDDGAMIQYRASDGKFVTRTEIVTTRGTLLFNCGSF